MHDTVGDFTMPTSGEIAALADRLRLLAEPCRLTICAALLQGESNPSCLAELAGVAQPALSQQLSRLRLAGVVKTRRAAQKIFYELSDPAVIALVRYLLSTTSATEQVADVTA